MSLQLNLSGEGILKAYQDVLNANGIDWAVFTYDRGTNDLKLQGTGDGGLEELEEEFSDGRYDPAVSFAVIFETYVSLLEFNMLSSELRIRM